MPTWDYFTRKKYSARDFDREFLLHPRRPFMANTLQEELQHLILSGSSRTNYEGNLYLNALPGDLVKVTDGNREICPMDKYLNKADSIDFDRTLWMPRFEREVFSTNDISASPWGRGLDVVKIRFRLAICPCFHRKSLHYVTLFLTDSDVYGQLGSSGMVSCGW